MDKAIVKFKMPSLGIKDKALAALPFGRQIEYLKKIQEWLKDAKSIHISQKRVSYTKAIKEAIDLYDVKEYYCKFYSGEFYFDDSFEFFYKN